MPCALMMQWTRCTNEVYVCSAAACVFMEAELVFFAISVECKCLLCICVMDSMDFL